MNEKFELNIDYKILLIKYLQHVANHEGTFFIGKGYETEHLNESEMMEIEKLILTQQK